MSHLPSLRISKQAARPTQSYESNELQEAQRDRFALPIFAIGQLSSNSEALLSRIPAGASFSEEKHHTGLRRSTAMSDWLSEHSFEFGLAAGVLGLLLIIGLAMLDFFDRTCSMGHSPQRS